MCEQVVCVSKLCVVKLCVSKLCVSKLCVEGGRAGGRADGGIQNQKQEPHTKMWGIIGLCSSWPLDRQLPIIPVRGFDCRVGLGSLFHCSNREAIWLNWRNWSGRTLEFVEICFKLL